MIPRNTVLRVARPTDHLAEITKMYVDGLGFELIGQFQDHDGFDGSIIGHPQHPYHMEFTQHHSSIAGKAPTQDNLLIFYLPAQKEWEDNCYKMKEAGFIEVPAYNPYWDVAGKTFEDVDGYRVVLQNRAWAA